MSDKLIGLDQNQLVVHGHLSSGAYTDVGTAATADLTTSNTDGTAGRVLKVGDGGWMGQGQHHAQPYGYPTSFDDVTNQTKVIRSQVTDNGVSSHASGIHFAGYSTWGRLRVSHNTQRAWIQGGDTSLGSGWTSPIVLSADLLQTTGTSTDFPMSQKATTDQLATKANASTQVIAGTGLTGGGTLAANRTLSVNYGTAAGTAAQGNDSRITGALQTSQVVQVTGTSTTNVMSQKATTDQLATKANTSTQVIAGTGLTGGGNLSANRTLSVTYGTAAGTAVQGNDSRVVNALQRGSNLSDVSNTTTARSNLGLGTAAVADADDFETKGAVKAKEKLDNSKTLDLNFTRGVYSKDDGEYSQTSTATELLTVERSTPKWVFGPNGKLREVPPNTLARQWNPETGEPEGVLIEDQRTNLLLWSEDFTNEVWGKARITVDANAIVAPDGLSMADKLIRDTDDNSDSSYTDSYRVQSTSTATTISFYLKAAGPHRLDFYAIDDTGIVDTTRSDIDLTAKAITNGELFEVGGGWFRVSIPLVTSGTAVKIRFMLPNIGDGTNSIYIWGVQLEEGSFPSSYIPTEGAQVTRAADNVSRALGAEFNANEGTWLLDVQDFRATPSAYLLRLRPSGGEIRSNTAGTGLIVSNLLGSLAVYSGEHLARQKIAISYKVGGPVRIYRNGVHVGDSTQDYQPGVVDTVVVSTGNSTRKNLGMCYFPRALSEQELIALTTPEE